MKNRTLFKNIIIVNIIFFTNTFSGYSNAQNNNSISQAQNYYNQGSVDLSNDLLQKALNNYILSYSLYTHSEIAYAISHVYSRLGMNVKTKEYAHKALNSNPTLQPHMKNNALELIRWADKSINIEYSAKGDTFVRIPETQPPANWLKLKMIQPSIPKQIRRCLDVSGGANVNRTNVQIFECNGTKSQQWEYTNKKEIRNAMGRCLEVSGGVNANRTNVQIFDCNRTGSQQWEYTNKKEIRNAMGRCLEVSGGVNANRTNVQIFDCNRTGSQKWKFTSNKAILNIMN